MARYRIVRFYRKHGKPSKVIKRGLTLAEAQKHCTDPSTSTAEYFDGYENVKTLDNSTN